jgi:hypothetical protein
MEWTVGPIPFEDGLGREVVLRYSSGIRSGGAFFTDANGRAMVRRARDARPTWDLNVTEPQAGNFYPVTAAIYLQDEAAQPAVLTERAQGAALVPRRPALLPSCFRSVSAFQLAPNVSRLR